MAKTYKIAVIPGDGTGPEVTREAIKVLDVAAQKYGFKFDYSHFDFGAARYLKTGEVLWTTPGGGDCTPAIVQDALAVQTSNPKVGILAGKLTATSFTRFWNLPYDPLRSQASPLILGSHVYLMDDNIHYCFDLETGRELWKETAGTSAISSPVLADGKIFLVVNNGAKIIMLKPSPEKRIQLGKANARALWVPSPAIADGKLLLRGRKGISCYSLAASSSD